MLLVIMTRSLIRLDNTVRASLNNDAITETDSGITRDDRDEIVITKGYESITRSYKREREVIEEKEKELERKKELEKEKL